MRLLTLRPKCYPEIDRNPFQRCHTWVIQITIYLLPFHLQSPQLKLLPMRTQSVPSSPHWCHQGGHNKELRTSVMSQQLSHSIHKYLASQRSFLIPKPKDVMSLTLFSCSTYDNLKLSFLFVFLSLKFKVTHIYGYHIVDTCIHCRMFK